MKSLELKVPPLIQVIVIGTIMAITSHLLPKLDIGFGMRAFSAAVAFAGGLYFCIAGVLEFRKHKTTVDPRYPDNVSELVSSGVYRLSRNPMYVGFALFLIAIVLILGSPFLFLGVIFFVIYMNRFQIKPEESYLSKAFGTSYSEYRKNVRRWV